MRLRRDTVFVFCQEAVPTAAQNDFDNIPACAGKVAFQFLDDFARYRGQDRPNVAGYS